MTIEDSRSVDSIVYTIKLSYANDLEAVSKVELRAKTYTPEGLEKSRECFWDALTEEGIFRDLGDGPADWLAALERLVFLLVKGYHYKDRKSTGETGIPERLLRGVIRQILCKIKVMPAFISYLWTAGVEWRKKNGTDIRDDHEISRTGGRGGRGGL